MDTHNDPTTVYTHIFDPRKPEDGTTHGQCRRVRSSLNHCGEPIAPFIPEWVRRAQAGQLVHKDMTGTVAE